MLRTIFFLIVYNYTSNGLLHTIIEHYDVREWPFNSIGGYGSLPKIFILSWHAILYGIILTGMTGTSFMLTEIKGGGDVSKPLASSEPIKFIQQQMKGTCIWLYNWECCCEKPKQFKDTCANNFYKGNLRHLTTVLLCVPHPLQSMPASFGKCQT